MTTSNKDGVIIKGKYTYASLENDETKTGLNELPLDVLIVDTRRLKDFKLQSFGGYAKSQVLTTFEKSIREEKCNHAIYWALQMLCSGSAEIIWDKLISIAAKTINILNPTIPSYILTRTSDFYKIISQPRYKGEACLTLRNNGDIRVMITEFTVICANSRRNKLETLPSIKKTDFVIDTFKSRLEAKDTNLSDSYLRENDPSEIRIAANEFAFHLFHKNQNKALYWLSWINEWSKLNCKKYGKFDVGIRAQADVDSKYYRLWPWMIWDIIIGLASKSMDIPMYNEVTSLWNIYKLKFTSSQISRKLPLIIWAAKYLTTPCDWKLKLIEKESILFQEMMNINIFFKSFKTQCTTLNTSTNVIIQNNYKKPPEASVIKKPSQSSSSPPTTVLTESQRKQATLFALDRYLE
jgi:hypothetical protein